MIPERLRWLVAPDSTAGELGGRFTEAGHELFLVGGSVRDALMDRPHDDLDFATDARPDTIKSILAAWADNVFTVGEAYGTIGAMKGDRLVEITTFRSEVYQGDSRKPEVAFGDSVETDLSRRDFSINAMALKVPDGEIIDPFGGLAALATGSLTTPVDPIVSFSDDPLRMLRLFRFQATLGFEPDEASVGAVRAMSERLSIVAAERIRDELAKLLVGAQPSAALLGVVETGLADEFLPELAELRMAQDPFQRHKDVLAHTAAVVDKTSPRLTLRLAALLHDIGKPATREFGAGGVTFHHHEVVGARLTRDRLRELRFPKHLVDDVTHLVALHLRPHTFKMGWSDSAVRRYVRDAGELLEDLNELVRCDVTTRSAKRAVAVQERIDELEERIAELRQHEELASLRPPIDGHAVMRYLDVESGPEVGTAMRMLTEMRIERGPYSIEEAYIALREWALSTGRADPGEPPLE